MFFEHVDVDGQRQLRFAPIEDQIAAEPTSTASTGRRQPMRRCMPRHWSTLPIC